MVKKKKMSCFWGACFGKGGKGPLVKGEDTADEAAHAEAKLKSNGPTLGSARDNEAYEKAAINQEPGSPGIKATAQQSEALETSTPHQPADVVFDDANLRAVLLQGKMVAAAAAEQYQLIVQPAGSPASSDRHPSTKELSRLQDQLTTALTSGLPGLHRTAQLLNDARKWLASCGTVSAADGLAKALLNGVLSQIQSLLLSCEPCNWGPDTMAAGLALFHLYSDLSQQALNPRPHAKALRAVMTQSMLMTPAPLTLLMSMLQVAYQTPQAVMEQHPLCTVALWDLLRGLVKMAVVVLPQAETDSAVNQLAHWQPMLGQLTQQPGQLATLLRQPLDSSNVGPYMAGCQTLRTLYELQTTCPINDLDVACQFVEVHFTQFVRYYRAAGADPRTAAAELCRLHMRLLQAAVATPSVAVRAVLLRLGAVDVLLAEVSLEAKLYSQEQAQAALEAQYDGSSETDSDADEAVNSPQLTSPSAADAPGSPKPSAGNGTKAAPQPFKYTYDLNEDLERLLDYEEATGETVELAGFEYDDEARELIARFAAKAALHPSPPPCTASPRPPRNLPPLTLGLRSPSRPALRSGRSPRTDSAPESSRLPVPKLALGNLRSAASSRIVTPVHQAPDATAAAFQSARSRYSQVDSTGQHSSSQLSVHGGMTAFEVQQQAHHSSRSVLSQGSYKLRSHASNTEGDTTALAAAYAPRMSHVASAASSRLHHSHLSPLSTRRSAGASPRTTVAAILLPTAAAGSTTVGSEHPRRTTNASSSLHSSRLALTSYRQSVDQPQSDVTASSRLVHEDSQARATSDDEDTDLSRQITCAEGMGAGAGSTAIAMTTTAFACEMTLDFASEVRDTVSELQPRPPPQQPLSAERAQQGGQAGRGIKPVPALNLRVLTTPEAGLSSSQRGGALSTDSAMPLTSAGTIADSAMNPNHFPPSPTSPDASATTSSSTAVVTYQGALYGKLWYHDMMMHASLLRLLLQLLLGPAGGLDPAYAQPFPADAGVGNVEHVLTWHFAGPPGAAILPELLQLLLTSATAHSATASSTSAVAAAAAGRTTCAAAVRLLRLLSRAMFDPSRYTDLVFHSRGAYGAIYRAKAVDPATGTTQQVMIKAIELPSSGYDRCVLPEVYGEVSILDKYALQPSHPAILPPDMIAAMGAATGGASGKGHPGICQLLDYGITQSAQWFVMRRYRCSLAEWRTKQPRQQTPAAIAMYCAVLEQVGDSMGLLAMDAVVHFDLKAANVLLEALEGVKDGQLYGPAPPPPCLPPFRAVLADFGQARVYGNAEEAYTVRNRGTEVYKSPEMLLMHSGASQAGAAPLGGTSAPGTAPTPPSARNTHGGAGLASDVWSFGCLVYEILAGRPLFAEADYASVTHRVAFGTGPNLALTANEVAAMGLGGDAMLQSLVEGILVRDPLQRPSLKAVLTRLGEVRAEMLARASTSA